MQIFELIGCGFDGGTDDTDDRILWVKAPSRAELDSAIIGAPCMGIDELPDDMPVGDGAIDFTLPADQAALCAKLHEFCGAATTS